jgi:hypothetical protein
MGYLVFQVNLFQKPLVLYEQALLVDTSPVVPG